MVYTLDQRRQMLHTFLGTTNKCFSSGDVSPVSDSDPIFIDLDYVAQHLAFDHQKSNGKTPHIPGLPSEPRFNTPPTTSKPCDAMAQQLQTEDFVQFKGLSLGEISASGIAFTPWELTSAYPTMYIGKGNRPKARPSPLDADFRAEPIFEDILDGNTWDFFYVYNPRALQVAPKLFVPTVQFENFLRVVNALAGVHLTIPAGAPDYKFRLVFGEGGSPRPRFLGRSTCETEFRAIRLELPVHDDGDLGTDTPEEVMDDFIRKLEALKLAKNDVKKEKNAKRREEANMRRADGMHSVQRMLGLRPVAGTGARTINAEEVVPHNRDMDVVFGAVDLEVAEESHGTILEVGISIFDTRDTLDIAPGVNAQKWRGLIQHHHLLVYETRFKRNHKYCHGCPEAFNFGTSETLRLAELATRVRALLAEPTAAPASDPTRRNRTLILVGHDIASDLNYLHNINVNPGQLPGFLGCADTKDMHQTWRGCPSGRNLGAVCDDLEIFTRNLHNAGNDAAYTLQAMLGLAVRARVDEQQGGVENTGKTADDSAKKSVDFADKFHKGGNDRW
ncbi:hypothetical protein ACHAQH_001012 [Verticillium albo-atrum]